MELHIKSKFDCVFLINGEFFENARSVTISEFDILYITVLPLKHTLLTYTVKLDGARTVHTDLYDGIRLDDKNYLLILEARHMSIYCCTRQDSIAQPSVVTRLFSLIKNGDAFTAYSMLSESLKASIDKNGLIRFFDGYDRIEECFWEEAPLFYLIDSNGGAHLYRYTLSDGFIDNIEETEGHFE